MKNIAAVLVLLALIVLPLFVADVVACAETYDVPLPDAIVQAEPDVAEPEPYVPGEPLTWPYLGTIAGAAALALLIVQFTKVPLDMVWKIPTKLLVYVVCLVVMLVATAITDGLTIDNAGLVAVNALLAAITAYGAYEVTFKHADKKQDADEHPT